MEINQAIELIKSFEKDNLKIQIRNLEKELAQKNIDQVNKTLSNLHIQPDTLDGALTVKKAAGQINVIIHALGILLSLPYVLDKDEVIQNLSLGAGNTGKPFDLETNRRVAEYKFIHWKGGAETIRKNNLFKDFFLLAEHKTDKKKCLYVLGTEYPLKFLLGGRALDSVMSRNKRINTLFHEIYGDRFNRVYEYYEFRKNEVELIDLIEVLPGPIRKLFI